MWFDRAGDARLERCATEGCGGAPIYRLEAGGVGSNYCSGCRAKIEELAEQMAMDEAAREYRTAAEEREMAERYRRHPHG